MTPFIKICGLHTANDVQVCIEAGADGVGFVLSESPRQVPLHIARRLLRPLPAHVTGHLVVRQLDELSPSLLPPRARIQGKFPNPGFPNASLLPALKDGPHVYQEALALWAQLGVHTTLLIDGPHPGTGTIPNWDRIARVSSIGPICLAGGLTPDNVHEAISKVRPFGVDVSSGVESTLGCKDPQRIRQFIQAAREAAAFLRRPSCIR